MIKTRSALFRITITALGLAVASLLTGYFLFFHYYSEGGPYPKLPIWISGILLTPVRCVPLDWIARIDNPRVEIVVMFIIGTLVQFVFIFVGLLILWRLRLLFTRTHQRQMPRGPTMRSSQPPPADAAGGGSP